MNAKGFFRELGYLYTLFRLGYQEAQRKKEENEPAQPPIVMTPTAPVMPAPAPQPVIRVQVVRDAPAGSQAPVRPSTCGLCTSWSPLERDRNARHRMGNYNGICLEYNRIVHKDSTICFDERKSEKLKEKPPRPEPPEAAPVVREEKPIVAMSDEELERRLNARDMLRLIADAEDLGYEDERKACAVIMQNHYKPPGYVSKLTNPKNKDMKDLFDREAIWDHTLTVRENNQLIRDVWRSAAYSALV